MAAAKKAFREVNAHFLTAVMEGKYLDCYLEKEGADAPVFTDDDMKIIGQKLDWLGLNIYFGKRLRPAPETKEGYHIFEETDLKRQTGIADFYFEVTGCNSEDFTEGNEAYAYLVGWAAGCIANVLIKEQIEVQNDFANTCVDGIIEHKKEIYDLANKYLNKWTMDRLNKVDQAILSLGIYELVYTDTPSVVAINEAIELSKKYSDEAVTKMINGVLDKIYHEKVENE